MKSRKVSRRARSPSSVDDRTVRAARLSDVAPSPAEAPPSLRERHQDATRDVVVDALVAMLETDGAFEFSMFELARRSGVSVRTIYRHFPTRDALFDAVSKRVNARVGMASYPRDQAGIVALVRALFPAFDRESALIKAQMQTGLGRQVRTHAQKQRLEAITHAVRELAPHLTAERTRAMSGAIWCLMSADVWLRLRNTLDMDGVQSGEIIAWAIQALFEAVRTDDERAKRARKK